MLGNTNSVRQRTFMDTLHGYKVVCGSRAIAWALIRNQCYIDKVEVPTIDKVIEVEESVKEQKL